MISADIAGTSRRSGNTALRAAAGRCGARSRCARSLRARVCEALRKTRASVLRLPRVRPRRRVAVRLPSFRAAVTNLLVTRIEDLECAAPRQQGENSCESCRANADSWSPTGISTATTSARAFRSASRRRDSRVTCHGSIDSEPNVNSVVLVCARRHDEKRNDQPQNPEKDPCLAVLLPVDPALLPLHCGAIRTWRAICFARSTHRSILSP